MLDNDLLHNTLVTDERMTASSFNDPYTPPQARLSGIGWCSASTDDVYIEIDFGAELVVEAIVILPNNQTFYVMRYMLQYAGSDGLNNYVISNSSDSTVSMWYYSTACYTHVIQYMYQGRI